MENNNIFSSFASFVCQEFNPVFNNLSDIYSCCTSLNSFESVISQLKWEIVKGNNSIKLEFPPGTFIETGENRPVFTNDSLDSIEQYPSEEETSLTIDDVWGPIDFELDNIFGQHMKTAAFTGWRVSSCFIRFLRELVSDFGVNQYYPASVVMFMSNSLVHGRLPNELMYKPMVTVEIIQTHSREVIDQLELSSYDNKYIKFHSLFLLSHFTKDKLSSVLPEVPILSFIQEPFNHIWSKLDFNRKFIVAFALDPSNCIDSEDAVSFIDEKTVALVVKLPCFSTLTTGFNLALVIYYDLENEEIKSMNYEIVFCVIFLETICSLPDFHILRNYHDSLSKLQRINRTVFGTKITGYSRSSEPVKEYNVFAGMNENHFDDIMNEYLMSSFVSIDYKN